MTLEMSEDAGKVMIGTIESVNQKTRRAMIKTPGEEIALLRSFRDIEFEPQADMVVSYRRVARSDPSKLDLATEVTLVVEPVEIPVSSRPYTPGVSSQRMVGVIKTINHATGSAMVQTDGQPIALLRDYRCIDFMPEVGMVISYQRAPTPSPEKLDLVTRAVLSDEQIALSAREHGVIYKINDASNTALVRRRGSQPALAHLSKCVEFTPALGDQVSYLRVERSDKDRIDLAVNVRLLPEEDRVLREVGVVCQENDTSNAALIKKSGPRAPLALAYPSTCFGFTPELGTWVSYRRIVREDKVDTAQEVVLLPESQIPPTLPSPLEETPRMVGVITSVNRETKTAMVKTDGQKFALLKFYQCIDFVPETGMSISYERVHKGKPSNTDLVYRAVQFTEGIAPTGSARKHFNENGQPKRGYATQADAEKMAAFLVEDDKAEGRKLGGVDSYRCRACTRWHVGHSK